MITAIKTNTDAINAVEDGPQGIGVRTYLVAILALIELMTPWNRLGMFLSQTQV